MSRREEVVTLALFFLRQNYRYPTSSSPTCPQCHAGCRALPASWGQGAAARQPSVG
jgi:hypothetical protein